ncbi:hypothetical protein BC828DRAFT_389625 [Blastocladiella britannica]|nr:hypothetical protein BC828DRAFT_389625 [Blastocladiella britannica]
MTTEPTLESAERIYDELVQQADLGILKPEDNSRQQQQQPQPGAGSEESAEQIFSAIESGPPRDASAMQALFAQAADPGATSDIPLQTFADPASTAPITASSGPSEVDKMQEVDPPGLLEVIGSAMHGVQDKANDLASSVRSTIVPDTDTSAGSESSSSISASEKAAAAGAEQPSALETAQNKANDFASAVRSAIAPGTDTSATSVTNTSASEMVAEQPLVEPGASDDEKLAQAFAGDICDLAHGNH